MGCFCYSSRTLNCNAYTAQSRLSGHGDTSSLWPFLGASVACHSPGHLTSLTPKFKRKQEAGVQRLKCLLHRIHSLYSDCLSVCLSVCLIKKSFHRAREMAQLRVITALADNLSSFTPTTSEFPGIQPPLLAMWVDTHTHTHTHVCFCC